MFEEPRQYLFSELVRLSNDKAVADIIPADNVIQGGILHNFQNNIDPYIDDVVGLNQKRGNTDQSRSG